MDFNDGLVILKMLYAIRWLRYYFCQYKDKAENKEEQELDCKHEFQFISLPPTLQKNRMGSLVLNKYKLII